MPGRNVKLATDCANAICAEAGVRCKYEWSGRRYVWNFYRGMKKVATVVKIDNVRRVADRLVEEHKKTETYE